MINRLKAIFLITIFVLAIFSLFINSRDNPISIVYFAISGEETNRFDQRHSIYDSLLKEHVQDAKVNYRGIINSSEKFNEYIMQLGSISQEAYQNWTDEEKLAFWINAYNAFTIKAIIDNYPIKRNYSLVGLFLPSNSIRQISGVWTDLQFRAVGRNVTLGEIEHEILRKEFNEPRIHFAINCASMGCPDLRNEAYRPDIIYDQLESQSIDYVNNQEKGVRIDTENSKVQFSQIFNWFGDDFVESYGNTKLFEERSFKEKAILNFVLKYLKSEGERDYLKRNGFSISYLDYDWSLNELSDQDSPSS
ncbi:DUF547 domain-containing protein [Desulfobacterota bacterium AH_259_B03_O07]|nr:DUF547 domain-containing protein [Desulfobacterota bacterium AH_259_B03_O07]